MQKQVVMPLVVDSAGELGATALMSALRREELDLRHRVFVAYVIDFGPQREGAYAAARLVRNTDWDSALYGDASGWVLRLSRTCRLTRDAATADVTAVRELATRCSGHVRGVTVEDLRHDDIWSELAASLEDRSRRREDQTATVGGGSAARRVTAGR